MTDKWNLAVQIYINSAWVDLTCDAGEIDIRQGFQRPDPLAPYEVGTCDLLLKGLTYAPSINSLILPGVPLKVFVFKNIDYHEFDNKFTTAYRVSTPAVDPPITLFTGSIIDAREDHRNNSVEIQAVDAWHKVVNMTVTDEDMSGLTFDELADLNYWTDVGVTTKKRDAFSLTGTGADAGITLGPNSQPTAGSTWLTPIQKGGPWDYELKVGSWTSGDFNFTVNRIKAPLRENCLRGGAGATVDSGTATSSAISGTFAPTIYYWRYEVVINSVTNPYTLSGIKPVVNISYMPVITDDKIREACNTALGTAWVDPENNLIFGNSSIWAEPWGGFVGPTYTSYAYRFSDDHDDSNGYEFLFGKHMCYRDFERGASLSGVVNSIEQTNLDESQVETINVEDSVVSVSRYGRRQIKVKTLVESTTSWTGIGILVATADPDAWVRTIEADLNDYNFNQLPNLLDWVRFEHDTTIQYLRCSGRRINLRPKKYSAKIELFDYLPFKNDEA